MRDDAIACAWSPYIQTWFQKFKTRGADDDKESTSSHVAVALKGHACKLSSSGTCTIFCRIVFVCSFLRGWLSLWVGGYWPLGVAEKQG